MGPLFRPRTTSIPARCTSRPGGRPRRWPRPAGEIARHLGLSDPKQILFTCCATESNNTAIFGTAKANPHRRHLITTAVEHPAVLEVCKELRRNGYEVTFLDVDATGTSTSASSSAPCGPTRCW